MAQVDLLDTAEQWDRIAPEWDALVAAGENDSPFRRFAWVRGWWQHYAADRTLRILTVRRDGRLIGIAPLFIDVEHIPFRVRAVRFLGGTDVCSEYLGLLIERGAEDDVVPLLLDFLFHDLGREWDVIRWTEMPAESRQLAVLQSELAARRVFHSCVTGASNLIVELPATWDAYVKGLTSQKRTKLRRIRREFAERENIQIEFAEDESQFERCWHELRMLHNRHWASVGQAGCFADPRFDAFHTEFARKLLQEGVLVLSTLRLDGEAMAACYAFRQGDTVYEYQRGHDPEYIRLRCGHALHFAMLEQMIGLGIREWDYLRGDYQHKRDWATASRDCVDLTIPAPRSAQLARFRLEQAYRSTRKRLGVIRRRLHAWLHTSSG